MDRASLQQAIESMASSHEHSALWLGQDARFTSLASGEILTVLPIYTSVSVAAAAALTAAVAFQSRIATRERNRLEELDRVLETLLEKVAISPPRLITTLDLRAVQEQRNALSRAMKQHRKLRKPLHAVIEAIDASAVITAPRTRRRQAQFQQSLGAAAAELRRAIEDALEAVRQRRNR
nr:hypothetical protein [Streptomyces antibioticus]